MSNKEIIDKAVTIYFEGGNWRKFLKEQVKRNVKFKEFLEVFNEENIEEVK